MVWQKMSADSSGVVFCGTQSTPPTKRRDLTDLSAGDQYFNTGTNVMHYWDGVKWTPTFSASDSIMSASIYCGSLALEPESRPNGSGLVNGDYFYDETQEKVRFFINKWL